MPNHISRCSHEVQTGNLNIEVRCNSEQYVLRWTNACPFAAGDSSQDEAEEDVKQVTVRFLQLFSLLWKVWSHDLCLSRCSLLFNQVRFSRPESEQARQRRTQSYEFLQKKQSEEPWVHLHYHGIKVRVIMWPHCKSHQTNASFLQLRNHISYTYEDWLYSWNHSKLAVSMFESEELKTYTFSY